MIEIQALLNPKVSNYGDTRGGIPDITSEMVAASLARAQDGARALIRVKIGDASSWATLRKEFRKRLAIEANRRRWKPCPTLPRYLDGICHTALLLYVHPPKCKRCKGRGSVLPRGHEAPIPCPVCQGAQFRDPDEATKASMARIPYSTWRDTWEDRYKDAVAILSEWEDEADRATKRVFWDS